MRLSTNNTAMQVVAVSSTHSLSVLLSAMETNCTTEIALVLARWLLLKILHICVRVQCILAAATIQRLTFVSFRASNCAATIENINMVLLNLKHYHFTKWRSVPIHTQLSSRTRVTKYSCHWNTICTRVKCSTISEVWKVEVLLYCEGLGE